MSFQTCDILWPLRGTCRWSDVWCLDAVSNAWRHPDWVLVSWRFNYSLLYIYVILNTTTTTNNNNSNNNDNNNNGSNNDNDNNNSNNRSNSSHNSNDSSNSNNNNLGISWTLFSGERREQIGARRLAIFPINKYGEPGGATNWVSQPHDGFSSILTIGYVRSVSLGNWRLFDDSVVDFATQCIVDYDHLWAGIPFLTNHFCWSWQSQWIGSREKIQDTYIHISIYVIGKSTVSCRFSLKPIHWQRLLNSAGRGLGDLMQKVTTSPVHIKYHPCGPHLMNISHASSTHLTLGEVMMYMYTCTNNIYIHIYISMYIHIHIQIHIQIHIHIHLHTYMHACIHAYMRTCIHASMHPWSMHPPTHPPIHPSIRPSVHTYIHTYTDMQTDK